MAKKKKVIKKRKIMAKKPWFKTLSEKHSWGFIPVNWQGWVSLSLLVLINVFSANYFRFGSNFDNWSKFGVVFLLSVFVFIEISRTRTEVVKNGKKK